MDLNYIDITIVAIVLITALIGFMRGLVWMSVFLATWASAIILAIRYKSELADILPIKLGSEIAQTGLAALLIFLGVLIAGAIINYLLSKAISAIGLGTFDRILGAGLGIMLGGVAISLLIMLLSVTELPDQQAWKTSKFIPKVQEAVVVIKSYLPEDMNKYINENLLDKKTTTSSPLGSLTESIGNSLNNTATTPPSSGNTPTTDETSSPLITPSSN